MTRIYGEITRFPATIPTPKIKNCCLKFGRWDSEIHGVVALIQKGHLTSSVQMSVRFVHMVAIVFMFLEVVLCDILATKMRVRGRLVTS